MHRSPILETMLLWRKCPSQGCHFVTFPMDALTPFWDYYGCCIRPYLPLRPVCFQEDPLVPPPEDLEQGVHTGVDPRSQADFLNGYKWGAPHTDQLICHHRQDQGQHHYLSTLDYWGPSSSAEPMVPETRRYANITYREVWLHDDDGADTHMDWPTEDADRWEVKERSYNYFQWWDWLQSHERLHRDYEVLLSATKHPDDVSGWTVNWSTLQQGLWYRPDQVTKATQYSYNNVRDIGPKSWANCKIDERIHQMIYDFKDDCAASQLHWASKEIYHWSNDVFADWVRDLWNRMKSWHEDDWDSDLKGNDDEDVCFTSEFHLETQLSGADILNGCCTLELSSILSPGQATTAPARDMNPYNVPEDDLQELPEWEQHEKLRPIPGGSSKADQETTSHLSQNNPMAIHPRLQMHSTKGSGTQVHEIMGIIHLRDLVSHLEHNLHLSEPVAPFLPAPTPSKNQRFLYWSSWRSIPILQEKNWSPKQKETIASPERLIAIGWAIHWWTKCHERSESRAAIVVAHINSNCVSKLPVHSTCYSITLINFVILLESYDHGLLHD